MTPVPKCRECGCIPIERNPAGRLITATPDGHALRLHEQVAALEAQNRSIREQLVDATYCDFHRPDGKEAMAELASPKEGA